MEQSFSEPFNLWQVEEAVQAGQLDAWLEQYLSRYNPALLAGLKLVPRTWEGPRIIPLHHLKRCCGPEPEMEFREEEAVWDARIAKMLRHFQGLESLPPLICQRRDGQLSIRDGNHRHELLRRAGVEHCWILIWSTPAPP